MCWEVKTCDLKRRSIPPKLSTSSIAIMFSVASHLALYYIYKQKKAWMYDWEEHTHATVILQGLCKRAWFFEGIFSVNHGLWNFLGCGVQEEFNPFLPLLLLTSTRFLVIFHLLWCFSHFDLMFAHATAWHWDKAGHISLKRNSLLSLLPPTSQYAGSDFWHSVGMSTDLLWIYIYSGASRYKLPEIQVSQYTSKQL